MTLRSAAPPPLAAAVVDSNVLGNSTGTLPVGQLVPLVGGVARMTGVALFLDSTTAVPTHDVRPPEESACVFAGQRRDPMAARGSGTWDGGARPVA